MFWCLLSSRRSFVLSVFLLAHNTCQNIVSSGRCLSADARSTPCFTATVITEAAAAELAADIRGCTGKGQHAITSRWRRWLGAPCGATATPQSSSVTAVRRRLRLYTDRWTDGRRHTRWQSVTVYWSVSWRAYITASVWSATDCNRFLWLQCVSMAGQLLWSASGQLAASIVDRCTTKTSYE